MTKPTAERAGRPLTVETLFVAVFALLGLRLGLRPIGDNSFFVHFRTGIDIVDGLGIPRRDPYSFTASGEPWVVQSWLASSLYGVLEALGGIRSVVLLHGLVYAVLGGLVATLARTGSAMRTAATATVAVGVGLAYWSPRPLAIGLVAMAVTVLAVERRLPPWALVPVAWVWVNSHGSFVLGGVWLVLVVVTERRRWASVRYLVWFAGGVALGAVNPLGPRLLLFPLSLLSHRQNFTRVVEWQRPMPRTPLVTFGLVCLAIGVVVLAIAMVRKRLTWRDVAPAAAFVVLGLIAQRNLAPAAIALAPVLGRALRQEGAGPPRSSPINLAFAAVIAAAAAVFVAVAATATPVDLDAYPPTAAFEVVSGERIVTTDVVGGYRIWREGRAAQVFVDDRYDMYPEPVIADYVRLLDGDPRSLAILDQYRATSVIWPEREELAATLDKSRAWRRVFEDDRWVVYVRAR